MTRTASAYTNERNSARAGGDLAAQVRRQLGDGPDAAIVFASSIFEYETLLTALQHDLSPKVIVGASSAGEFTARDRGEGTACMLAFRSDDIKVAAGLGRSVSANRISAAQQVVSAFTGGEDDAFPHKSALVLTDALAGHADDLVEQLTLLTAGAYQFAGGGAGDDARFARTHVFHGTGAHTDAVVALEIVSKKPVGIGVAHGWTPAGPPLRVSETIGARLISLNGLPAADAFERHAAATGQRFDPHAPMPFFLHNILGIDTGADYRLRVPLAVGDDRSVTCAAEIPEGSRIRIMKATADSAVVAAERAATAAIDALDQGKPSGALLFDCVATRLRMGDVFGFEIESVARLLGPTNLAGCNTYGQIARARGQFGGFHNCTAVVMVLPS